MSAFWDTVAQMRAWAASRSRALHRPPFWPAPNCPMVDTAGNPYDWSTICSPAYSLTGAVLDTGIEVGSRVAGSGLLISPRVVLTGARVVQGRDPSKLLFSRGTPYPVAKQVEDVARPRSGVTYDDPARLDVLVAQDSSDIALLRLSSPSVEDEGRTWVNLGLSPDSVLVGYLVRNPDARGEGDMAFADAVVVSQYSESSKYLTPVQWVAVSSSGSVLVAFNDHQPGEANERFGGVYSPAMDRGAPVVRVGSAAVRPEVVGVVSGVLAVPGAGTYYRITRCDRYSGWIADTLRRWFGGGEEERPDLPPPSAVVHRASASRRGSVSAAGLTLLVGAGLGLALSR